MARNYKPGSQAPRPRASSEGPLGKDPRHLKDITLSGPGIPPELATWNAQWRKLAAKYELSGLTPAEAARKASHTLKQTGHHNPYPYKPKDLEDTEDVPF